MRNLQRLFELSRDLMCVASMDGYFVEVNPAFQGVLGYSNEELTTVPFLDLVHPSDQAATLTELSKLGQGEYVLRFENRYRCKDGSFKWLSWVASPDVRDKLIFAVARDVTDSKQSLDDLLSALPGMIYHCKNDADWTMNYVSKGCLQLTGYSPEEFVDSKTITYAKVIHPDDRKIVQRKVFSAFAKQREFELEYRIVTATGAVKSVWERGCALHDSYGEACIFQGYIVDVTERRKLESELSQMQRMEALGHLTGGVAHDFNNVLTVVAGNLELLADSMKKDPESIELVTDALDAAWRGAELCSRLLAFSRRQMLESELTGVNELVRRVATMAKRTIGARVQIHLALNEDIPQVLIDQRQLENAILNLAINARDAMPKGGSIRLGTGLFTAGSAYVAAHPDVRAGDYVTVEVGDTGTGMSEEVRQRAFEPFFTTKDTGKGTGLGLSMVYGLMKQSGGFSRIYSELGHGTTVKLYIPVPVDPAAELVKTVKLVEAEMAPGGTERILVVEDDPGVRKMVVTILGELGYSIVSADSAAAALEILSQADHGIDLLFTDIVMPGDLDGMALAHRASNEDPGLKILLTSGFSTHQLADRGGFTLLNKPYQKKQLAAALRQVLES